MIKRLIALFTVGVLGVSLGACTSETEIEKCDRECNAVPLTQSGCGKSAEKALMDENGDGKKDIPYERVILPSDETRLRGTLTLMRSTVAKCQNIFFVRFTSKNDVPFEVIFTKSGFDEDGIVRSTPGQRELNTYGYRASYMANITIAVQEAGRPTTRLGRLGPYIVWSYWEDNPKLPY